MLRVNPGPKKRHFIRSRRTVSKLKAPSQAAFLASLLIFTFALATRAADTVVSIRIDAGEPVSARLRVMLGGERRENERFIWFLDEYGPVRDLAGRISSVGMIDGAGRKVAERRTLAGERIDTVGLGGLEYRMRLKQAESSFAAGHVSWVGANGGILMLDDMLPQGIGREAVIQLQLPASWKVFAPGIGVDAKEFRVANIEKTALRVGPEIRETRVPTSIGEIRLGISGDWLFADADAAKMAASIADEYGRLLGKDIGSEFTVSISRFPFEARMGNWEGDTRGRSVTIVSSDMPFKNQSLQRLHEQLRHEIFHLWIPNSVNLTGSYDWFYEGFALYQSLRTGVELNQLRFEDFLDTLSRAYDIDSSVPPGSLVDATRDRWNGSGTRVYARGMLVAFLCDLILLDRSKGKLSASDLIRDVFATHRTDASADGNAAVLAVIRKHTDLRPVVDRYIVGSEKIEWAAVVRSAGLVAGTNGTSPTLSIDPKASGAAKKTLQKLGIDNWRRETRR
jgi:hypothetical protein